MSEEAGQAEGDKWGAPHGGLQLPHVLDARGLPSRLELGDAESGLSYRISGWRFAAPKGVAAFRLATPPGYESVDMP